MTSTQQLATELLRGSGYSLLDAARILLELLEALDGTGGLADIRQLIAYGREEMAQSHASVSFERALQYTLEQKQHHSIRTRRDIRQTNQALMRCEAGLAQRPIRSLNTADCERILHQAYAHSPARYIKARSNLSGIFTLALRRGWCKDNPVSRIPIPQVRERTIAPLNLAQIKSLMQTAQHPTHRACLPALALMLYAGVRPEEVRRLHWQDIDWEEGELYMSPRHSKTGGGRHIPLCRPLLRLLKQEYKFQQTHNKQGTPIQVSSPATSPKLCPPKWRERWQYLRQAAGFTDWVPDILRHSFASYHAKHYKDLPRLQLAMGHRDSQLLLTRYINLRGITKQAALSFWKMELCRCAPIGNGELGIGN